MAHLCQPLTNHNLKIASLKRLYKIESLHVKKGHQFLGVYPQESRKNVSYSGNAVHNTAVSKGESETKLFQNVIEAQQFDRATLDKIFEVAEEMEVVEKQKGGSNILKGYLMATLFYEPSTRTRLSFESAMKRLGGEVLTTENAREFSSAAKGESLQGENVEFYFTMPYMT